MKKIIGVLSVLSMLAFATPAFAATISDARFSNSDVTIDAQGNSTLSGTYTLTVGPNEAIEWQRVTINGLTTDLSIGDNLGKQEGVYHNLPFTGKVPPNTSTFNVDLSGDGIYGANRAVSPVDVNANSWMGPVTVGTVRVIAEASNTTTSGSSGGVFGFTSFADFLAAIKAGLGMTGSTNTNPNCPVMVYDGSNAYGVQTWLMNHGQAGPFNAIGVYSATGFWGSASIKAYTAANVACAH